MSAAASENFAVRLVTAGFSSLANRPAHALLDLLDRADMGEGAAAEFGGARHQIGVRRRADADHEHARAAAQRGDGFEQLLLVADRAVGQEHDLRGRSWHRSRLSVSAARIAGTISVPPSACSAPTNEVARPICSLSAGTDAGNSTSMV